jgi:hypothetical protein
MTTRVIISVEGQTEEAFVRHVLAPHLVSVGIDVVPIVITTRRVAGGRDHRGGYVPYRRLRQELRLLLRQPGVAAVTTLYDLYGLPPDVPGVADRPPGSGVEQARHIERALAADVREPRFRPHLQVHEFEALLFAAPERIVARLGGSEAQLRALRAICEQFESPEEIDNHPKTSPSHRLLRLFPQYDKVVYGPLIASDIGLSTLRMACPHFGRWLSWLERLSPEFASGASDDV